jgi:hypothetical protein
MGSRVLREMPVDELEVLVADNTLAALGDVFGLTAERVRQILAMRGVRTRLGHNGTRLAVRERAAEIRRLAVDHTEVEIIERLGVSSAIVRRATGPGVFADARGQRWTRELVIQRIQENHRRYGHPPGAVDWNVGRARTVGRQDLVDRFYTDGCWPHGSTLRRWFKNWNAAIRAPGFEPLRPGEHRRREG